MTTMNEEIVRETSERIFAKLASDDVSQHKSAAQELTDYTRIANKEGTWMPRILDATPYDRSMLVPQMHTDQPVLYFEYEIEAPFSVPVDFGSTPTEYIPKGRRYAVTLQRVHTQAIVKELLELEVYRQDIRMILADKMTKDLIAMRDFRFMRAVRKILGTNPGTVLPWVGKAMYQNLGVALTHNNLNRAKDIMRDTRFNIEPTKLLCSHLRRSDFESAVLDEVQGTQMAVDLVSKGFSQATYQDLEILFTNKQAVVPKADMFMFGPQEFLGRYIQYMPPTMSVQKPDDMVIKFYQYEVLGMTLAHPGALIGVQFQ
jgi:hypothetical protein